VINYERAQCGPNSPESKTIAFNVSGHGFMDMQGYREVLGLP